ncbi:MAG: PEP-CTERM sorting domain-containing protein [Pirellulaceae bacterium]
MLKTSLRNRRQRDSLLSKARWAGYAAAGAAAVLGAHESAEAGIVYRQVNGSTGVYLDSSDASAVSDYRIDVNDDNVDDLQLQHWKDQPTGFFGAVAFGLPDSPDQAGIAGSASFASNFYPNGYVEKSGLTFGSFGTMAFGASEGNFLEPGDGYIGFSFKTSGNSRYGWLRVTMKGADLKNAFTIRDFAYEDTGEGIQAGDVPEPGSLGLLATGAVGLLLWRRCRRRNDKTAV